MEPVLEWLEVSGLRLKLAREKFRHTQTECARQLTQLGATRTSQTTVSEWERGQARPRGDAIAAIAQYCESAGVGLSGPALSRPFSEEPGFESVVHEVTGEPLLGPRQRAVVDAITARMHSGPPLSPDDMTALRWLRAVVGLGTES